MDAAVPTIDLASFRSGTAKQRGRVAAALDAACSSVGFMQIIGHGIPDAIVGAMLAATDAFFALPLEDKVAVRAPHAGINRGYSPSGSEALAYSLGIEPPSPDLFEAFNIGPEVVPDEPWYRSAPHDLFAKNLWPDREPSLRSALTAYFDAAAGVALTLTDVFALALGMPERWFFPYVDRSTVTLRVNHYERRAGDPEPGPGQMRMGAHTDYGIVTVLYADPVPGLQIVGPDGAWHDVVPEEGALLVNLGDLTAQWTNDRWRSTLHRVVVPPPDARGRARRRSVALFFDGNYDANIACLPTCTSENRPPKYPPVIAGEHLIAKILGPRTLTLAHALDTAGERKSAMRARWRRD
jgi:isopenicillin N synthase-like dioxygenase